MRFPKKRPENASLLVRAAEKADGVKIALLCAQVVKESLRQVDAVFYLSCAEDWRITKHLGESNASENSPPLFYEKAFLSITGWKLYEKFIVVSNILLQLSYTFHKKRTFLGIF